MDLGSGPVVCAGGRTQWSVGGDVDPRAREVLAPSGVVDYEPAEMVVRVRAGTTVRELDAVLAPAGQMVPLDPDPGTDDRATVGGVLAVGHSGYRRLRYGPVRDTLLEARIATADGKVVKAGGPVVKNVTGFDLCRLFVGSLGTLGFLVEAVLRCQPRPHVQLWLRSDDADPFAARQRLFRPSSILWDGTSTWVLIEGRDEDVAAEEAALGPGWRRVDTPPALPDGGRESLRPGELRALTGQFVAEVGVGTVHRPDAPPTRSTLPDGARALNAKLKRAFDPEGRLNPGRHPWT